MWTNDGSGWTFNMPMMPSISVGVCLNPGLNYGHWIVVIGEKQYFYDADYTIDEVQGDAVTLLYSLMYWQVNKLHEMIPKLPEYNYFPNN